MPVIITISVMLWLWHVSDKRVDKAMEEIEDN